MWTQTLKHTWNLQMKQYMIAEDEQEKIDYSTSPVNANEGYHTGVNDKVEQSEQIDPPTPPKPRKNAKLAAKALKESEQSVLLTLLHKNEFAEKDLFTLAWAAIKEHRRLAYKAVASEIKKLFKTNVASKPIKEEALTEEQRQSIIRSSML